MKIFPNMVFEHATFERFYFFNTDVAGFAQAFYIKLLKETLDIDKEVMVFETIFVENYEKYLFNNLHHPEIVKSYRNFSEFKLWMEYATMQSVQCLIRNSSNSIQIYADPHDWDVCIIACKTADEQTVKDWLIKTDNFERRMKSIDEFHDIWNGVATKDMFDYAWLNLKKYYMPFIQ